MPDPATNLVTWELTEIAIQYLCERDWLELNDSINSNIARQPTNTEELLMALSVSQKIRELGLRPPARRRGRPPQHRERHLQIAGAVAMLVEDTGLDPTRSHCGRRHQSPSACSIVTAALKQLGKYMGDYGECRSVHLSERRVEGIWDEYRLSPLIIHRGATDYARNYARNHYRRIVPSNSPNY